MNEKNQVVVDLIAEPERLKRGYDSAVAESQRFQQRIADQEKAAEAERNRRFQAHLEQLQRAKASQAEVNQEAERFVQRMRDQAATLGMSGTALDRYRASQISLTQAQRESVELSLRQIDAYNAKAARLENLARVAARAGAALGAAAIAAAGFAVREAAQAERSEARFGAVHRATGMTSGFSLAEHEYMVGGISRATGRDDEEVRDAMSRLMTYRQVSGETFREAMQLSAGLAEVMGGSLASAAETLGRALEDPERGLSALTRAGLTFSPVQRELIKEYVEHGKQAEAMGVILQALKEKGFAGIAQEVNKPGGYTHAFSAAGKATSELFETLGKSSVIKAPVVGLLEELAEKTTTLKNLIERGTWWQRLAAMGGFLPGVGMLAQSVAATANNEPAPPMGPEEKAAREAAAAHRWQSGFDAQQAGLREFLRKRAEKEREEAEKRTREALAHGMHTPWRGSPEFAMPVDDAAWWREQTGWGRGRMDAWEAENLSFGVFDRATVEAERARRFRAETGWMGGQTGLFEEENLAGVRSIAEAGRDGAKAFEDVVRAIEATGMASSKVAAEMLVDWKFSGDAVRALFRQIAVDITQLSIQRNIVNPFMQYAEKGFPGLFGSGSTPTAPAPGLDLGMLEGGFDFPVGHSGGIAGELTARRRAHPALFIGAPRFHRGYPGLGPNEMPAIIDRREEVITPSDPRHRWNGGGKVTVNIINQSGVPVAAEASAPQFDGEAMIVSVVLRDLDTGGPIRDKFERMRQVS